ncbi:MAG TPA: MBL fold metallo-hydrolase [Vicinamibacterales bacterium]|nr:MBL fold metallo-hydrolase [Vicinamibacterales bacterium]
MRHLKKTILMTAATAAAWISVRGAQLTRPEPRAVDIAPGIVLFVTPPYGEVGLDGNALAVVSTDGVLVFDANGTPSAAAGVLAAIRKLTDQPVRYLVLSHWHWDHWYGAQVYKDAFPDIKIVAHEKTRTMMAGPAIEFNRPGLESGLPGYVKTLEQKLAAARATDAASPAAAALAERLEMARFFLEQKSGVRHTLPDVTFKDRLDVTMGERRIQILNYGRAVTPGDAFIYLPAERVLATGDLLVNPISFALSCYPTEWVETLNKLDALEAAVIVPGHGLPLRDKTLLHATRDLFRELLRRGREAKANGLDVDAARDAMLPDLQALKTRITGGDASLDAPFRTQLVDWYLHRVYDELDGPLTDAIAPIPSK